MTDGPSPRPLDTGLACLALLARFHGIAADPAALRHRHGAGSDEPVAAGDVVRAARGLGLRSRAVRETWEGLRRLGVPAILELDGGRFVVAGRVGAERLLVQDPLEARPRAVERADLEHAWTGRAILVTRRAGLLGARGRFGVSWFLSEIRRYRALLLDVLAASLFVQLIALATPLFFQVVVDKVLVHEGLTTLDVLAIGMLAVALFDVLLGGLRTYVFSHTANRIDVTLGARLFRHVLALPMAYFESRRVGDTVARVRELETVRAFLTSSALTVVVDLGFTFVFFAVMYWYSPALTGIVAATVPLYLLLSIAVTPPLRARLEEKFTRGADNQAFLVESVTQIETLKSMAVEPQMQRRWEDQLAAYVRAAFRATHLGNVAGQAASFVNKVTVVLIIWLGARLVIEGEMTVGQLVAFNMLAARVSGPVLRLVQLWQDFQQARVSLERLGDVLDAPVEPGHGADRATLPPLSGAIELDGVTFRYRPDGPEAVRDLSLVVPAGQVLGVVGRSGSGKSTLVKLLLRLHVPERGRVLVDGADVSLLEPGWLRRQIGVVPQECRLFDATVRENIALAEPGMPVERVVEAAKLAGAHEFVASLPEGYETRVGEQGCTLSGGQRQRIAIARALAARPSILVLDEATSALDVESERAVQRNMQAICKGRTVIIVAHRLSALRAADRIVVMEAGRIVQEGSHAELLGEDGPYARLHAMQGGVAPAPAGGD